MTLLKVGFALLLLALAVAVVVAVILPFADCEQGFTVSEYVIPYCGTAPTIG